MQIQLPGTADVAKAVEIWSSTDARLAHLLQRYGDYAPALRHYGLVLWEGGQLQAASQALTGAAALTPKDARVWNDLASVFNALGQRHEAAACAEESLAQDPTQSLMWLQLGAIRAGLGDGPASVAAYRRALEFDANLVDAWVGLGLAYYGAHQFHEAIMPFREAVECGKAGDSAVQGCLGQALYSVGDFSGAASAFAIASALQPDNHTLHVKRARAQFVVDAIHGTVEDAVAACERLALSAAEIESTIHDGFHLLSAYGYKQAAITVGTLRLARVPDDKMQAYLLDGLKGEMVERAPDSYIVSFFDKFADEFDHKLVDVLGYRVPGELADLVQARAQAMGWAISHVLDLGCGTGLVGSLLARPDRIVRGVDLSPRMLDKARRLGCYESLTEAEVVAFLTRNTDSYDVVIAADVLIYFGDLSAVFGGVACALSAGGLFALSIETSQDKDISHLPSGRFAHGLGYLERMAAEAGFIVRDMRPTTIRLDAEGRTQGALLVMSRDRSTAN